MEGASRRVLVPQSQTHTHIILEDQTWSIQWKHLQPHLTTPITFNNKNNKTHSNILRMVSPKPFTKHCQTRNTQKTNRSIDRATQKHTSIQTSHSLPSQFPRGNKTKQKITTHKVPDKLNISHLKNTWPPLDSHSSRVCLKTALKNNIIPHTWKLVNIVPYPKPQQKPPIDNGHLIQAPYNNKLIIFI